MSEMLERVAKAVFDSMDISDGLDGTVAEKYARAAIEAMREPTQQMRLAAISDWSRPDPTDEHANPTMWVHPIWRAMIDAALRD